MRGSKFLSLKFDFVQRSTKRWTCFLSREQVPTLIQVNRKSAVTIGGVMNLQLPTPNNIHRLRLSPLKASSGNFNNARQTHDTRQTLRNSQTHQTQGYWMPSIKLCIGCLGLALAHVTWVATRGPNPGWTVDSGWQRKHARCRHVETWIISMFILSNMYILF